jgi:hypothetical protein
LAGQQQRGCEVRLSVEVLRVERRSGGEVVDCGADIAQLESEEPRGIANGSEGRLFADGLHANSHRQLELVAVRGGRPFGESRGPPLLAFALRHWRRPHRGYRFRSRQMQHGDLIFGGGGLLIHGEHARKVAGRIGQVARGVGPLDDSATFDLARGKLDQDAHVGICAAKRLLREVVDRLIHVLPVAIRLEHRESRLPRIETGGGLERSDEMAARFADVMTAEMGDPRVVERFP